MGRLYYEKTKAIGPEAFAGNGNAFNNYLEKVATLVPSEIIAGYLTLIGFVEGIKNAALKPYVLWGVFALGLILTPIYLNKVADADKPKMRHLLLSTIAFVVWAYVTTGKQLTETIGEGLYDPSFASIVLVAFSLISGGVKLNK